MLFDEVLGKLSIAFQLVMFELAVVTLKAHPRQSTYLIKAEDKGFLAPVCCNDHCLAYDGGMTSAVATRGF